MGMFTQAELEQRIKVERRRHRLPGLAVAFVEGGRTVAAAAAGRRRSDRPARLRLDDPIPIGSTTKPFTTTTAALLADSVPVDDSQSLGQFFPAPQWDVHPDLQGIPLDIVLRHQGGLVGFGRGGETWNRLVQLEGDAPAQRETYLRHALRYPPFAPPGDRVEYTPIGFIALARLLETRAGVPFEQLVAQHVLARFGLQRTQFGMPHGVALPYGHRVHARWWNKEAQRPRAPERMPPRPLSLNSSSGLWASTLDLARFVALQLAGRRGEVEGVPAAVFERLHEPVGQVGLGWFCRKIGEHDVRVHGGWVGAYAADMRFAPASNAGFVLLSNSERGWPAGRRISLGLLCDMLGEPLPDWADDPGAFQAERPRALTSLRDPPWIFDDE